MDEHQLPTMKSEAYDPHPTHRSSKDNELDSQRVSKMSRCSMPSLGVHRFIALICISLLGFGYFFCQQIPEPFFNVRWNDDAKVTLDEFSWLYSINHWLTALSCFVGGFLIDHVIGTRLGTIFYLFILLIGQLIFATGCLLNTFWLMMCGRFLFGISAGSLAVAQNIYAVLWFKGKNLNMVFGLQLLIGHAAISLSLWAMPPIFDYFTKFHAGERAFGAASFVAGATCALSFILALILGYLDRSAERILQRNNSLIRERPKLSDIFTFKITFWMVAVISVAYYVAVIPFIVLAPNFLIDRFLLESEEAFIFSGFSWISGIAAPILGFVIDKIGHNLVWVFAAILSTIAAQLLLAFTPLHPYVGFVIMGLAYGILATSLWGLVALLIPEHQLGTAYGICLSIQYLGYAVITKVAVMIVDKSDGSYIYAELFFLAWLAIALIASFVIYAYNGKTRGKLNTTPKQPAYYARAM